MSPKEQIQRITKTGSKPRSAKSTTETLDALARRQPHPAPVIQRARLDPRSLTSVNMLQLQGALGNQAVSKLLFGVKPRPVMTPPTPPAPLARMGQQRGWVQRDLLDQDNWEFLDAVTATYKPSEKQGSWTQDLVAYLQRCQEVMEDYKNPPEEVEDQVSFEEVIKRLLNLQMALEIWKDKELNRSRNEQVKTLGKKLTNEIRDALGELTKEGVKKLKAEYSAKELAEAKSAEFKSLAMRILVSNVATYAEVGGSEVAKKRYADSGLSGDPAAAIKVEMGGTIEKTSKDLEEAGAGACTNFAYAVADRLSGEKRLRVEVVSWKSGDLGHVYVLLGRKEATELNKPATWGEDCVALDAWEGAMNWQMNGELPQVVYEPVGHWSKYPASKVLYDSKAAVKAEGTLQPSLRKVQGTIEDFIGGAFSGEKKTLAELKEAGRQKEWKHKGAELGQDTAKTTESDKNAKEITEADDTDKWKIVGNLKEAETMAWGYQEMFQMGNELYIINTKWPRVSGGGNSDKKEFKDWVENVGTV